MVDVLEFADYIRESTVGSPPLTHPPSPHTSYKSSLPVYCRDRRALPSRVEFGHARIMVVLTPSAGAWSAEPFIRRLRLRRYPTLNVYG